MQYNTNDEPCQIDTDRCPLEPVQTPHGLVSFQGQACPWDREAVRGLVWLLTQDDDLPAHLAELTDLVDLVTCQDWPAAGREILRLSRGVAALRDNRQSRAVIKRLTEILGRYEPCWRCPKCGEEFGSSACLHAHFISRPLCRVCSDSMLAATRLEFALCVVCQRAIVGEMELATARWSDAGGLAHARCVKPETKDTDR